MISNMEEPRRETERANEVYIEDICDDTIDLQRKGRTDLMYQKAQQLVGITTVTIIIFGIKDNQGNLVTDNRRALRICGKYIRYFCNSENCPISKKITKDEEELNEDDK